MVHPQQIDLLKAQKRRELQGKVVGHCIAHTGAFGKILRKAGVAGGVIGNKAQVVVVDFRKILHIFQMEIVVGDKDLSGNPPQFRRGLSHVGGVPDA